MLISHWYVMTIVARKLDVKGALNKTFFKFVKRFVWIFLTLSLIVLSVTSCSNQVSEEVNKQPGRDSTGLESTPVSLEPNLIIGHYAYPNVNPVYQGFPDSWLPLTQETEFWYVLAGPGLLVVNGVRVQAFDSTLVDTHSSTLPYGINDSDYLLWEIELPKAPVTAPLVSGDMMIWALPGYGLIGVDRATGQMVWKQEMPGIYPLVHLIDDSLIPDTTMDNSRVHDSGLILVSDRLAGLRVIELYTGRIIAGPFQQVTGQVVVLENTGLLLATQSNRFSDMSEDQFILSSLLPFAVGPVVQIFHISQSLIGHSSQHEWSLQAHGSAVGGAIHPSGQGVLIYTILGSRRMEARHLTVTISDSGQIEGISSRVIWSGNEQIGLNQSVRIQGALDSRAGVWPLVVVSKDNKVKFIHGGVGVEIGVLPIQPIRDYLSMNWLSETKVENEPSEINPTLVPGTILVPGVRADHLIGLRFLDLPGITSQVYPLIWSNQLRLITPWGLYGAQIADQENGTKADLAQSVIPYQDLSLELDGLRQFSNSMEFFDRQSSNVEPLIWNLQDTGRIRIGFPAQISPLHIRLTGNEPGTYFYQNLDADVSPLLIQVYNKDHLIYTNATHVSLDYQGRFELSDSQEYVIQISWAQGDESLTYGLGKFILEKQ
jgi:hypothetical protein